MWADEPALPSRFAVKTIEYTTIDKSTWDDGPWMHEPDKRQWQDETTGMPCLIVRSPVTGSLCGYVGVSRKHKAYRRHYNDVHLEGGVHGGLTFSGFCQKGEQDSHICHLPDPGEDDKVWWLGFDSAHWQDRSPAMEAHMREMRAKIGRNDLLSEDAHKDDVYRDINYISGEVASMAQQLSKGAYTLTPITAAAKSWLTSAYWRYVRNAFAKDRRLRQMTWLSWRMAASGAKRMIVRFWRARI